MNAEEDISKYLIHPAALEALVASEDVTKRDFFAGCALIGMLANSPEKFARAAEDAFDYAEEMLRVSKERSDSDH